MIEFPGGEAVVWFLAGLLLGLSLCLYLRLKL